MRYEFKVAKVIDSKKVWNDIIEVTAWSEHEAWSKAFDWMEVNGFVDCELI